jgi:hypothetical protein
MHGFFRKPFGKGAVGTLNRIWGHTPSMCSVVSSCNNPWHDDLSCSSWFFSFILERILKVFNALYVVWKGSVCYHIVRYEDLTVVTTKMSVFSDVVPHVWVESYWHLRRMWYRHLGHWNAGKSLLEYMASDPNLACSFEKPCMGLFWMNCYCALSSLN